MNWRTTAVLFLILALLAGYLYYDSQQPDNASEPVAVATTPAPLVNERIPLITNLTIDTVDQLTITRSSDSSAASFSRDNNSNWTQTSPQAQTIISSTLTTQLTGFLNLTSNRAFSAATNPLSAYGLEPPTAEITVASSDQRQTIFVGNETPTNDGYYVQTFGDPRVFVVTKGPVDNMLNLIDNPPIPLETP